MSRTFAVREDAHNRVIYREIEDLIPDTHQAIRRGWFAFMQELQKVANREILRKPKSGRVYFISDRAGRRRRHVASAPGETHANLSGATRRSLSWNVDGWESATFGYGVSTSVSNGAPRWAPYLEFGTSRMAERPSLKNAIDMVDPRPFFDAAFGREVG